MGITEFSFSRKLLWSWLNLFYCRAIDINFRIGSRKIESKNIGKYEKLTKISSFDVFCFGNITNVCSKTVCRNWTKLWSFLLVLYLNFLSSGALLYFFPKFVSPLWILDSSKYDSEPVSRTVAPVFAFPSNTWYFGTNVSCFRDWRHTQMVFDSRLKVFFNKQVWTLIRFWWRNLRG